MFFPNPQNFQHKTLILLPCCVMLVRMIENREEGGGYDLVEGNKTIMEGMSLVKGHLDDRKERGRSEFG